MANEVKKYSTQPVHVRPEAFKKLQKLAAQRVLELEQKQHGADVIDFLLEFHEQNKSFVFHKEFDKEQEVK